MHPPRDISASPEEIASAPLADFLAMLGKSDLLIGGKHARKKIVKHLQAEAGQHIALSMALESDKFDGVEVSASPSSDQSEEGGLATVSKTSEEDASNAEGFDAIGLHHLALAENADSTLKEAVAAIKPGGKLVLHDLIWRQEPPQALLDQAPATWGQAIQPNTVPQLWAALEAVGLSEIGLDLGAFAWFRPKQFARDESKYASDIIFNALNNPNARTRYLAALDHFNDFSRFYGYVVISGKKAEA